MTISPIKKGKAPMTPATTQILFIDLQPEIVASSKTNDPATITRAAVAIARIAKLFALPVTASVTPTGSGMPRLLPELEAELPSLVPLVRTIAPVFDDTPTADAIKVLGRHDLVV